MAQESRGPISSVVNVRSMIPLVFLGLVSSSVSSGLVISPSLSLVFPGLVIALGSLLRIRP